MEAFSPECTPPLSSLNNTGIFNSLISWSKSLLRNRRFLQAQSSSSLSTVTTLALTLSIVILLMRHIFLTLCCRQAAIIISVSPLEDDDELTKLPPLQLLLSLSSPDISAAIISHREVFLQAVICILSKAVKDPDRFLIAC